jgi:hypothetical protein
MHNAIMRSVATLLALCAVACAPRPGPPPELEGLWSRGEGACEAGLGVTFGHDAVRAQTMDGQHTLFAAPVYSVERRGAVLTVRIRYQFPDVAGAVTGRGRYGLLELSQDREGWLRLVNHYSIDTRAGSARLQLDQSQI